MRSIITLTLFFLSQICSAQKLEIKLDRIHPIILNDNSGDSIRKHLSYTFFNYDSKIEGRNTLKICAFYSNRLAVNYKHALEKIPQLRTYINPGSNVFEQTAEGYGGKFAIPIFDSTGVIITVNGINAQNAYDYEFRILEDNKKVVLDWKRPKIFADVYVMSRIADPNKIDEVTAYLGQFKEDFGKALTFQVRQLSSPDSVSASITAYWVRWQPKVVGVFTFAQLPEFLSIFRQQWYDPRLAYERPDWSKDSTLLKQKKKFLHNENNLIFYLDDIIKSKNIIEYRLFKGRDSTKWAVNDFDFNLVWLKNLSPGRYELQIRYSVQRTNVCHYVFNIEAAWYQTLWAKLGLTMLGLLAIGFVALLWRSKKQAENLKTQSTLKQVVQTELKSIRSQFNPHFVFNALSSIQGLITKNDPENASKYLIEFSNLMRDSLKASTNEFVSIASEVRILENYLKLEKLRFGFQYDIIISDLINVNAIEIPSLFLQPLVENAVKHGISSLQENGLLAISFQKSGNNMEVNVTDNGKGFEKNEQSTGFGLQLTKERIKLLNQTLQEQKIEFSVYRISDKTRVTIHFKDWLL